MVLKSVPLTAEVLRKARDCRNAVERVADGECARIEAARAAHPEDPYCGLMALEDVELLRYLVSAIDFALAEVAAAAGVGVPEGRVKRTSGTDASGC